ADDIRLGHMNAGRILFFGNSITISPMSVAGTNWTGGWGMAASVSEKDYVHLVVSAIAKAAGNTPKFKATYNIEFEKNYATYDFNSPVFQKQLAFKPDIVVVAIGENVLPLTTPEEQKKYATAFGNLLEQLKNNGNPRIFVRSCYWADKVKDDIMKQAALAAGCVFVDQSSLGAQANWAINESGNPFQNAGKGVNAHPGDKSMKAIADSLFETMATNSKKK
ncbi:MAG: SGNH/GDSL hydrolase family protein, partial [Pirellulales bacterium]|nr:SGNH/GDSL hydrolase family protein [Pirellulales bacterium]